jgi:hypothetical protein
VPVKRAAAAENSEKAALKLCTANYQLSGFMPN